MNPLTKGGEKNEISIAMQTRDDSLSGIVDGDSSILLYASR